VPVAGGALAVAFVSAVSWQLNQRRPEWLSELAEAVEDLRERIGDASFEALAENSLFVDAVVTTTRAIDHTHQEEKIAALRNAVLNSVAPNAPDADMQAMFLNLVERFTPRTCGYLRCGMTQRPGSRCTT
jgi:ribosomal protein L17